jgi:hypothetical protein
LIDPRLNLSGQATYLSDGVRAQKMPPVGVATRSGERCGGVGILAR